MQTNKSSRRSRGLKARIGIALLLLGLTAGCATSSGLKQDRLFGESQERLAKTTTTVRAIGADPGEAQLFIQAESFYEFRFAFPPRSPWGQLTEIAASVTDFPALQSLSGSLDLSDQRLGAYDSATYLWESLLQLYPKSKLRELTLYRLGWAYRSTSAQGLPGDSDHSFAQLASEFPGSKLADLAQEVQGVPWKSKAAATWWSLIPGGGQLYVGEVGNGTVRFCLAAGGLALFLAPAVLAVDRQDNLTWEHDWPLAFAATAGLVVLSVDYSAAYQDAIRGVVQFNEAHEHDFLARHPEAP